LRTLGPAMSSPIFSFSSRNSPSLFFPCVFRSPVIGISRRSLLFLGPAAPWFWLSPLYFSSKGRGCSPPVTVLPGLPAPSPAPCTRSFGFFFFCERVARSFGCLSSFSQLDPVREFFSPPLNVYVRTMSFSTFPGLRFAMSGIPRERFVVFYSLEVSQSFLRFGRILL